MPIASMSDMAVDGCQGRFSGGVTQPTSMFCFAFFWASRNTWWCMSMIFVEVGDAELSTFACMRVMGVIGDDGSLWDAKSYKGTVNGRGDFLDDSFGGC